MSSSNYYKLPLIDGLEALDAVNYNTPFPFHFHPTYNISLVYEGVFETKLSDKSVSAVKGTILVTNPHEIHANPCIKADARSFFTFYLTADFFEHANNLKNLQFKEKVIYNDVLFAELHAVSLKIKSGYAGNSYEKQLTDALKMMAATHGTIVDEHGQEKITAMFDTYLDETHFEKFSLQHAADQLGLDRGLRQRRPADRAPVDHAHHVRAAVGTELGQEVVHMVLDRAQLDVEGAGDLLVGETALEEPQDVLLAPGQLELVGRSTGSASARLHGDMAQQAGRDLSGAPGLTTQRRTEHVPQVVERRVARDVTDDARLSALHHLRAVLRHSESNDLHPRPGGQHRVDDTGAVLDAHIHQHDVAPAAPGGGDRRRPG